MSKLDTAVISVLCLFSQKMVFSKVLEKTLKSEVTCENLEGLKQNVYITKKNNLNFFFSLLALLCLGIKLH